MFVLGQVLLVYLQYLMYLQITLCSVCMMFVYIRQAVKFELPT